MIFGDTASGKSRFAEILATRMNLPLVHLDKVMEEIGRSDRTSIGQQIKKVTLTERWIIEGNAFTKDPEYRIKEADRIFVFDFSRTTTFINYIKRYVRLRSKAETRKGSDSVALNLSYFIPYIFIKFPPRKKQAVLFAKSLDKEIITFRSYKDIDNFLNK